MKGVGLMNKDWRQKLNDYYHGNLSEEETNEIENELAKLDDYQAFMDDKLDDEETKGKEDDLPPAKVNQILKDSIRQARFLQIGYIIMILLLIYPLITISGYFYYGLGHKGNNLIDVAIHTLYVTEPNTSTIGMDVERQIGMFSMNVDMDLYKRVGKKDIRVGDWQIMYQMNEPQPNRSYLLETAPPDVPYFDTKKIFHPDSKQTNGDSNYRKQLENLPEGTVSEAYVSLDQLVDPGQMDNIIDGLDVEWRWFAIDTGMEAMGKDTEGRYLAPIGYPAQHDEDNWSPFHDRAPNDEQFIDSLHFLKKYEDQATKIARGKSLELDNRLAYLEKEGLNAYGGVLTGPTKEILKLQDNHMIRAVHIGEVRLWNW